MQGRFALVVALLATALMCAQNAGSGLAFGWALIHAGPLAVIVFWPLAIGLATLWGAFWYLSRSHHRQAVVLFTGLAVAILFLYEVLLPATPLKTLRSERAMKAADVRNIRDELLLSAKGNPIGVRVTYEVVFPRAVVANVHIGLWREGNRSMQSTEFGHHTETIHPEPSSRDFYNVFEGKRLYRFTATQLPGFLEYRENTQQPCLRLPPYSDLSEADIVSAIREKGHGKYRMDISVTSDIVPVAIHRGTYVTSREYDLEAMFQTIVREGHQQCRP